MKKYLIAVIVGAMVCNASCIAQDSTRALSKNAVYLELGGNGVGYSLSFERMIYQKDNLHLCARVGSGIAPRDFFNGRELSRVLFPLVEVNILSGKRNDFFETGIGYTYDSRRHSDYTYTKAEGFIYHVYYYNYFFLRLGYRYQGKKGFMLRLAATPVLYMEPENTGTEWNRNGKLRIAPWGGLSFGYSF